MATGAGAVATRLARRHLDFITMLTRPVEISKKEFGKMYTSFVLVSGTCKRASLQSSPPGRSTSRLKYRNTSWVSGLTRCPTHHGIGPASGPPVFRNRTHADGNRLCNLCSNSADPARHLDGRTILATMPPYAMTTFALWVGETWTNLIRSISLRLRSNTLRLT